MKEKEVKEWGVGWMMDVTHVCVCDIVCQYPVVDRIRVQVKTNVKSVMMVLCDR